MKTIAPLMASEIARKNQRCHPPAFARKLNAAPSLYASTRLNHEVSTRTSPGWNACTIHAFVARSSTMTTRLTSSQRGQARSRLSRMAARLAGAVEIRDAATADRGVAGDAAHIRAVMPAALALRPGTGRDDHAHVALGARAHLRGRRDEHEA